MLPRMLYWLTLTLSVGLFVLVISAPLFDDGMDGSQGVARAASLFAHDATLRRTSIACSIGLLVTACVFFRQPEAARSASPVRGKSSSTPAKRTPVVGA
ncbi:MAG: hypothetical protein K2R98_29240 [Gemmataceae bacterium]|nr:hypothetical protein [Gemmataceae bacterium]